MERKTLKGKLHAVDIDYKAPDIPVAVAALQPAIYQEGSGFIAWYEKDGKKYYGFGNSAEAAMMDFDRFYQSLQPKPQQAAAPVVENPELVFVHAFEGVQSWFNHRVKSGLLKHLHW